MISVPVMSEGMRSGVNWIRLKVRWSVSARLEISRVFAKPGTPTSSAWLRVKIEINTCSMTSSCPMMTFPSSLRTRSAEDFILSTAEASKVSVAMEDGGLNSGLFTFSVF